ncbi:DUF5753 domain-containing protein [Nocardia sp. NPDC059195]|uniref:DUF5753 domain-containing protein n=1 Tax=Nocardia sp. NPDC059195 TaxID=3346765 RepID=UPI0036A7ACB0
MRSDERGEKSKTIAQAVNVSPQYWSQLAQGKGVLAADKLEILMDRLEFEPDEQVELRTLREIAKGRNPYSKYSALFSAQLMRLYGLEDGAHSIRSFENCVVPGLLQCEDYIRVLMKASVTISRPTEVEQRVQARLQRQRRLDEPSPLRLSVVIGEAVLANRVGGPDIHRQQLCHLRDLVDKYPETLDLRVIPFEEGTSIASLNSSTFHLLDFESARLPPVGWFESTVRGEITDDPDQVKTMEYLYEQVHKAAVGRDDTIKLIGQLASRIR